MIVCSTSDMNVLSVAFVRFIIVDETCPVVVVASNT